TGRDVSIDARETAPAAAPPERYLDAEGGFDRDRATNGAWSAGIPGLPAAFVHIQQQYGKLPLSRTLAPAIRIAREGFPVYGRMVRGYAARSAVMERYPGTREVYLPAGRPIEAGDVFRQPDLARTLEALAQRGHQGFYGGDVGAPLVAGLHPHGGARAAQQPAAP